MNFPATSIACRRQSAGHPAHSGISQRPPRSSPTGLAFLKSCAAIAIALQTAAAVAAPECTLRATENAARQFNATLKFSALPAALPNDAKLCAVIANPRGVYVLDFTGKEINADQGAATRDLVIFAPGEYTVTLTQDNRKLGEWRQLVKSAPFFMTLDFPRFRHAIFPAMNLSNVTLDVQAADAADVGKTVTLALLNPDGKPAGDSRDVKLTANATRVSLPLPDPMPPGNYRIVGRLGAENITLPLVKYAATPGRAEVYYDADNNMYFNGKRFFPLGFYYDAPTLDAYTQSGYNTVIDVWSHKKHIYEPFKIYTLNKCNLYIQPLFAQNAPQTELNEAVFERTKKESMDAALPYSLGWYGADEPEYTVKNVPLYREAMRKLRDMGAPLPLCVVHNLARGTDYDGDIVDVMMVDPYLRWRRDSIHPVIGYDLIVTMVDSAVRSVGNRKPVWVVLQCLANLQADKTPRESRFPTIQEIRMMSYLGIIRGARGVMYYRSIPHQAKALWGAMKAFGEEITFLHPFLFAPDNYPALVSGPVHSRRRDADGASCFFVANTSAMPAKIELDTGFDGPLYVLNEDRTVTSKNGKASLTAAPYASHVLLTRRPPEMRLGAIMKNYTMADSYVGIYAPGNIAGLFNGGEPFATNCNPWRKLYYGNDEDPTEAWEALSGSSDAYYGVTFAKPAKIDRITLTADAAPRAIETAAAGSEAWQPVEILERKNYFKHYDDATDTWVLSDTRPKTANAIYPVYEYRIQPVDAAKVRLQLAMVAEVKVFPVKEQ